MHAVDLFMSCRLTAAGYLAAEAAGKTRGKGKEEAGGGGAQQDGAGEEEARGDEDGGRTAPAAAFSGVELARICGEGACANDATLLDADAKPDAVRPRAP